jgi:ABC-type branched-subunit amino acid transport system ATPase component
MIAIFLATFSGGEQQMLAIARGIMSDPEVFIIDELSLGLAPPVVVQQLTSTLEALKESGMTILLVERSMLCVVLAHEPRAALPDIWRSHANRDSRP